MLKNLEKYLDRNPKPHQNVNNIKNLLDNIQTDLEKRKYSTDAEVAENIVDRLFVFIHDNVTKDSNMNTITKATILFYLPGILKGSKEYIQRSSSVKNK